MTMMILLNRCLGLRQRQPMLAGMLTAMDANLTCCVNMRDNWPAAWWRWCLCRISLQLIALVSCWCKQDWYRWNSESIFLGIPSHGCFLSLATVCVEEISKWIATGNMVATSGSTCVLRMDDMGGNVRDMLVRNCAVLDGVHTMCALPMVACVNEHA